jgi:lysyl-tRNA synthetase class II
MNKSELRNEKINSVLDNKENSEEIKWTELPEGILATTHISNVREFGKNKTIAKISTDYFGGWGIQEAKLFVNNKKEYSKSSEQDMKLTPINDVLKMMGVIKKGPSDEFDTINLSNYRSNEDFK